MTPRNTTILLQLTAVLLALAAAPGLCTEADWWDEAEAEDTGYRVANYEEKFENEGIEEGEYPECSWECSDSRSTDWYITETDADVKYKPEGGEYAHVDSEGGAGTVEVSSTARVYVHYWPGVLPTDRVRSDDGTATSGGDTTLTDTSKSWESSEWAGGMAQITGGTGAGQAREISGNTATEVTVTEAWETNPDNTSQYHLEGPNTGRYEDYGYVRVYCKRPHEYCEPPAKCRELWVLDCNLESTRGGTPGNANDPASPNNGDGSVQDRAPYDFPDDDHVLPLTFNDDDDNEDFNMTPDREESGPIVNEDDLAELEFQFTFGLTVLHDDPKEADKGTVRVRVAGTAPDGNGKHPRLKIWRNPLKGSGEEIAMEWDGTWYTREYDLKTEWATFASDLHQRTLFVEGYEPSREPHDAVIELEYELLERKATDTVRYTVLCVDIDVETDRDGGSPERYDDELEEDTFNSERGAVVLTNSNSDRTDSTDKDNQDDKINESGDVIDTSHLVVRRPGIAAIPSGLRAILRIRDAQAAHFRIFDNRNEGEDEFLGPAQGVADGAGHKQAVMPNDWIAAPEHQSTWTFGVESIHYIREEYAPEQFNTEGSVEAELVYQLSSDGGQTWRDWASDKAQLQVAPCVFAWNGQQVEKVYANHHIDDAIRAALAGTGISVVEAGGSHLWLQDYAELTSTYRQETLTTRCCLRTIVDLKAYEGGVVAWPEELRQSESSFGYVMAANSGNGGAVEVTPPLPGHPMGRVMRSTSDYGVEFESFVKAQKIQVGDDGNLLTVDTGWLDVGHVDEIVCFVPKPGGYAVLVPSPLRAVDIMHGLEVAGNGDAQMRMGTQGTGTLTKTVEETLVRNVGGVVQITTLAAPVSAEAQVFSLTAPRFADGDLLRVDNEYVTVLSGGGTATITVARADWGPPATPHAAGAKIYALTDLCVYNISNYPTVSGGEPGPQLRIDALVTKLEKDLDLSPGALDVRKVPVLFVRVAPGVYSEYTSDVVNCLVAGGLAILPKTHGPQKAGTDYFEADTATRFAGLSVSPVFIDAWSLHMQLGEVHCGSNAVREPLTSADWWEAWPDE